MAVVKSKPTSAGRRHHVKVVTEGLHKGRPYAPLLEKKSKTGGRNNLGRITTRHIGGGHKQHYRKIDFKRTKDGIATSSNKADAMFRELRSRFLGNYKDLPGSTANDLKDKFGPRGGNGVPISMGPS